MRKARAKPVLGVLELPAESQELSAFGLYRVGVDDSSVVSGCLLGCIHANSMRDVPLICVFGESSAPVVGALRRLRAKLGLGGHEQIFRLRARSSTQPRGLRDIDQMLHELKRSGIARGSLLLFSCLNDLMPNYSERLYGKAMQRLHRGLKAQHWTACSVEYIASSGQAARLQRDTRLAGVALLNTQEQRLMLRRPYWSGMRRSVLQPVALQLAAHALRYAQDGESGELPATLEGSVIAQSAIWPADIPVPANWVLLGKPAQLIRRAQITVIPVCILAFDKQTTFDELTRNVHALRMAAGAHAGIYVRELDRRLRAAEQMILARVGMNSLLPEELSTAELCRTVEQARGQEYIHDVARNFETAMRVASEETTFGYLKPSGFLRAAETLMAHGLSFNIEACLVYLPLRPDVGHVFVLENLRLVRHGDIATIDERGVYVYLYGCGAEHADTVLARAFALPLDQLFEGHVIWTTDDEMDRALMLLQRRAQSGPLLDYALLQDRTANGRDGRHALSPEQEIVAVAEASGPTVRRPAARPAKLRSGVAS